MKSGFWSQKPLDQGAKHTISPTYKRRRTHKNNSQRGMRCGACPVDRSAENPDPDAVPAKGGSASGAAPIASEDDLVSCPWDIRIGRTRRPPVASGFAAFRPYVPRAGNGPRTETVSQGADRHRRLIAESSDQHAGESASWQHRQLQGAFPSSLEFDLPHVTSSYRRAHHASWPHLQRG